MSAGANDLDGDGAALPDDGRLRPAILEVTGGEVEAQVLRLGALEEGCAGLIAAAPGGSLTLCAHHLLAPGAGPGCATDPALQAYSQSDAAPPGAIVCEGPAAAVRFALRQFAARQFALVERSLHGRLTALWEGIPSDMRQGLRWHFILTVRRDAGHMGAHNPVHADTFDGTLCAFALMSTKVPTPIFPAATFAPSALERFVAEATGAPGTARPAEIHTIPATPPRHAREGALLLLPPCVAHSIPNTPAPMQDCSAASEQGTQLSSAGQPRWFARVSVEVVPAAGGSAQDGAWTLWQHPWPGGVGTRQRVALLAARHVWGDEHFAQRARARMGLCMEGFSW